MSCQTAPGENSLALDLVAYFLRHCHQLSTKGVRHNDDCSSVLFLTTGERQNEGRSVTLDPSKLPRGQAYPPGLLLLGIYQHPEPDPFDAPWRLPKLMPLVLLEDCILALAIPPAKDKSGTIRNIQRHLSGLCTWLRQTQYRGAFANESRIPVWLGLELSLRAHRYLLEAHGGGGYTGITEDRHRIVLEEKFGDTSSDCPNLTISRFGTPDRPCRIIRLEKISPKSVPSFDKATPFLALAQAS